MSVRDHIAAIAYAIRFTFTYTILPLLIVCAVITLIVGKV